jgi:hypothetical protein
MGIAIDWYRIDLVVDIMYNFETMDGSSYERYSLTMPICVFGRMIICYGLFIFIGKNL